MISGSPLNCAGEREAEAAGKGGKFVRRSCDMEREGRRRATNNGKWAKATTAWKLEAAPQTKAVGAGRTHTLLTALAGLVSREWGLGSGAVNDDGFTSSSYPARSVSTGVYILAHR